MMKKSLIVFLLSALWLIPSGMKADEGMWTLVDLPKAVYNQMVAEGYQLEMDKLYKADDAIYKAVVNFSGYCSGVVVSADGLVFTNHHCGFDAIRSHSTVEHDYLLNGFYAKTMADELPCKNIFVGFLVAQKDITSTVEEYDFRNLSKDKQQDILDIIENDENRRLNVIDESLYAELKPYYEANRYYIDVYRKFSDVRLVFTVPKSVGKFGGDTDNWMWPRQTCDFSVFRIYADSTTNGPARYDVANVPYHPKKWAQVSLQGYKEGDFAMTMGYPGSTRRYLSSFGIKEMRDSKNLPRWQTRGVKQEVMLRHMRADEAIRIKYDSKYASSSNYWKNSIGMNKCIDSLGIISLKQKHEADIQAFVDSTGYLKDKLDLTRLGDLYEKRSKAVYHSMLFNETFFTDLLSLRARTYTSRFSHMTAGKKAEPFVFKEENSTYDAATDKEMQVALLKNYAEKADPQYLPSFYNTIRTKYGNDYAKYVDDLWANSILMQNDNEMTNNKKSLKDLGVQYAWALDSMRNKINDKILEDADELKLQERYLCAAKLRLEENLPHYSDANFTLRMSYGQVGEYDQYGHPSGYYTTPQSLFAKMLKGDKETAGDAYNFEYFAEPVMHELFSVEDFGKYTDATSKTMNLCFLTTNDITGGNSGSPVFDGQNRLIGLAFDGNWESLSADIFFDKRLARCICVDVRYMLYMMDKWGHADRLLNEINAQ